MLAGHRVSFQLKSFVHCGLASLPGPNRAHGQRNKPGKPQDNGRLGRLHGTIQRELAVDPAAN
ncbi:MAG: transposase [Acidobacteria bacterium]|nr:transposase [Acidobacteriota bacterium]